VLDEIVLFSRKRQAQITFHLQRHQDRVRAAQPAACELECREMLHRFLLHNDDIRDAGERSLSPGQVGLLSGWGVFSTLRVYDGVMFAFERHWQRMLSDAARMRVPFPAQADWLEARLYRLIEANQVSPRQPLNATLRVAVIRNRGGLYEGPDITRDFDVVAFTIDVVEWPRSVKLGVVPQGRHAASEFAGTKYISWAENLTRYERAHEQGLDEVILLNERGEIAECTSANVFVLDAGGRVWTPPLSSGCLAGVTRAVLLEEVRDAGVAIGEKTLFPDDLKSAREIFITSTTRELLPADAIEGLEINGGRDVCDRLREGFSARVKHSVSLHPKPVYT
jgi:branched-chain amino acid aminotransferase